MSENNKTDRRVVKTRKAIHHAYVELMSTRGSKNVTVKEIADLADINRKTFYNHYNDISELADEIENDIIAAFDEAMCGIDLREILVDPEEVSRRLFVIGTSLQDICGHLMKIEYNGAMVTKISDAILASIMKSNGNRNFADERTQHMIIEFAIAGMMQTYQSWFYSDRSESIDELTVRIAKIIVNGINGVLKG